MKVRLNEKSKLLAVRPGSLGEATGFAKYANGRVRFKVIFYGIPDIFDLDVELLDPVHA